jgi:LysR family transcriptional regulator, hydrogen peroxide-inducible genes activator
MNLAPHPVTLRQLQYVVAVADRKSFRQAAEDCHVAQPSLSAQIAQVEDALNLRIFERDRRSVALTSAGEALVARARALLIAADELTESARRLSDPFSGTLRIGVIPTVGPYLLPEVAPGLRERFPKLNFIWIEDKTAQLLESLRRAELDGAILALEAEIGDLPKVVLGRDQFLLAVAPEHPLARAKGPLKADKLEDEQVLLLDDGHCFRDQALSFCSRAGAEEAGYRATSLATLVQMAASGHYVTLLPTLAVPVENRRRTLRTRPFAPKPPGRTLALVYRRHTALENTLRTVGGVLHEAYVKLPGMAE